MMIFLFVPLLWGFVAGRPGGVYPVNRQDFAWNEQPAPIPYQIYPSRPDGTYRVDRQEFGGARQQYPFNNGFRTLPQTNYNGNQYWYPHVGSVDYRGYQPNSVLSSAPITGTAYVPKLFVPAADQVFLNAIPVSSAPNRPSAHQPSAPPTSTEGDNILPAIPKSPAEEGEPLSALPDYSKRTTEHPIKYLPVDDEVEINDEQEDLLYTFHSTSKPERASQPHPRLRRHLYSSYPMKFKKQFIMHPRQPRIYSDVYGDPVEDSVENVPIEHDLPFYRPPVFDLEDLSRIFENFPRQHPDVVENNEIADDVASKEPAYSDYPFYKPYNVEDLTPALKNSIIFYPPAYSEDVVVVAWPEEPEIVSANETPTTVDQVPYVHDDDDDVYVDFREEEASETAARIAGDVDSDSTSIACEYAESETEAAVFPTTEMQEWTTESVVADSSQYTSAIFGGPTTDEADFDHRQENEKIWPSEDDLLLQLLNRIGETTPTQQNEEASATPDEVFANAFLKYIHRLIDDKNNSNPTEAIATEGTGVEFETRYEVELTTQEILGTTGSVSEADRIADFLSGMNDERRKLEAEYALFLSNQAMTTTTSETPTTLESIEKEYFTGKTEPESEEWGKNADDEHPLSDEDNDPETLMLDIVRQEPKVVYAVGDNSD